MDGEFVTKGWHWTFGWLRHPDGDSDHGACYERPNGDFVFSKHPRDCKRMFLEQWRRPNGEIYFITKMCPDDHARH